MTSSHVISPVKSQRMADTAAELLAYLPHVDVAVIRLTLTGPKGGVRSETVQLDGDQRRQLAAQLAGHPDWAGYRLAVVTAAIVAHLDATEGPTDDNADTAAALAPAIVAALEPDANVPPPPAAADEDGEVWSVLRLDQEDGLYLFDSEHRARQYAKPYGDEAVVNREFVMNDSAAGQFIIDSAGEED